MIVLAVVGFYTVDLEIFVSLNCVQIFRVNKFNKEIYFTRTLHAQAVMASTIEHVHRRACCVLGSVRVDFGTKTNNTVLLIRSTLLRVTADRVLDFQIGLCYSSGRYGGRERPCRIG